jgi:hypothetical protein
MHYVSHARRRAALTQMGWASARASFLRGCSTCFLFPVVEGVPGIVDPPKVVLCGNAHPRGLGRLRPPAPR